MAKPTESTEQTSSSTALAACLAWVIPGMGHWWLGHRARAAIFFVVITVTFWAGVAVGGVRNTISPKENGAWIAAQLCVGPQALFVLYLNQKTLERPDSDSLKAPWPASNISVVYAGVAGLLNLLVIIDAMARCDGSRGMIQTAQPPPVKGAS
jgi:hypothetical protein